MNSWCDKKDDDDHSSNFVFRERKTEIGFSVMKLRSGRNLEKLRESLYGLISLHRSFMHLKNHRWD
jgi:hypothetical protein